MEEISHQIRHLYTIILIYIYIPIFLVLILLKDFILRLSIQVLSALCVWCGLLYFAFGNSVRAC